MATFSVTANELKYASGSSWTSGKARQGVYSTTRYEGAINLAGLSGLDFSNIAVSQIQMRVTFGPAGGDSTKYLTFYKATKNSISGSIASMRGDSIGSITVTEAYNRTVTLTFSASSNAGLFNTFRDYFAAGNHVLLIYVPRTRGTYSGGFCYDYLSITALTMTLTFEYLQSSGTMAATSVAAGSAARLNITAYNSDYTHKVTWKFGSYTATQSIAAGTAYASYTIPLSWLAAIPNATSGAATVTLETIDTSGASLGSYSYGFTVTVPSSVVPSISSVTASPVNDNSVVAGWGIYVYGKSKAQIKITGATGAYGSTIRSYSITTSPNVGSGSAASYTTGLLYSSGTITVTAKITDSRGRTATKTTSFSVYQYAAPYFSAVESYRCNSSGARDDVNGTYARILATFGRSTLNGSNTVSCQLTMTQIGGSYSNRTFILEDTAAIMERLTATADLEAKAENLREEMDVVSELIRQAIEQNASMAMDQVEFEQRYQSLSERFQRAADQLKGIEAECARRTHKRSELETFIKNLRSRKMPIEEFDAMLWMSMVKMVTVEVDGSMRFTFANEMEVVV